MLDNLKKHFSVNMIITLYDFFLLGLDKILF